MVMFLPESESGVVIEALLRVARSGLEVRDLRQRDGTVSAGWMDGGWTGGHTHRQTAGRYSAHRAP